MKLQLLDAIGEITEARTAAGLWQEGQGGLLTGLSGAAKTVFLAALDRLLPEQGSLVSVSYTHLTLPTTSRV